MNVKSKVTAVLEATRRTTLLCSTGHVVRVYGKFGVQQVRRSSSSREPNRKGKPEMTQNIIINHLGCLYHAVVLL